jgi:hypothetical protein
VPTGNTQPEEVIVNVYPGGAGSLNRKINGTIQKSVAKSLTLLTGEEIPAASNVTVQSADLIFFGDVLSCSQQCDAEWTTQIRIERKLLVV